MYVKAATLSLLLALGCNTLSASETVQVPQDAELSALGEVLAPGVFKRTTAHGHRVEINTTEGLRNYRQMVANQLEGTKTPGKRALLERQLSEIDKGLSKGGADKGTSYAGGTVSECEFSYDMSATAVAAWALEANAVLSASQAPGYGGIYGSYSVTITDAQYLPLASAFNFDSGTSIYFNNGVGYYAHVDGACYAEATNMVTAYDNSSNLCGNVWLFEYASIC